MRKRIVCEPALNWGEGGTTLRGRVGGVAVLFGHDCQFSAWGGGNTRLKDQAQARACARFGCRAAVWHVRRAHSCAHSTATSIPGSSLVMVRAAAIVAALAALVEGAGWSVKRAAAHLALPRSTARGILKRRSGRKPRKLGRPRRLNARDRRRLVRHILTTRGQSARAGLLRDPRGREKVVRGRSG